MCTYVYGGHLVALCVVTFTFLHHSLFASDEVKDCIFSLFFAELSGLDVPGLQMNEGDLHTNVTILLVSATTNSHFLGRVFRKASSFCSLPV